MPSPEMLEVIERFRAQKVASAANPDPPSLTTVREHFAPAGVIHPVPDDVDIAAVDAGGVPAYWVTAPGADPDRVLVLVHGGGFMFGSLRSHGELAARLSRMTGMRVLFPEYRLAPEHPFPAGLHDVRTVWSWLIGDRAQDTRSVALVGDSAGGTLILGLLTALRDSGQEQPAAAVLLSPATDTSVSGPSIEEREDKDPIFTAAMIREIMATYLAGADPLSPSASPLFADLKGLAPLLIQVGSEEVMFSDSERLAAKVEEAGGEVELHIGEGLPHVYPIMHGTPEAAEAASQIAEFLAGRLRQ